MYEKLRPVGSQPARLYGLAKVHKQDTPVRPVLSIPGSAYHNVATQVAKWLSFVPECQINILQKTICDTLSSVKLDKDEVLVSFDVSSLYTNVPVMEAINVCADLLFSKMDLPVDKETFITLAKIASCDVIMSTHDGYYRQVDGLAMGSPPAAHLANGWLSQFDDRIKGDAKVYFRYMDDIFRNIKKNKIESKLKEINSYHPSLKFTCEIECDGCLPFLDMKVTNNIGMLFSTWYCKPTDTGLVMNFHALAPKKYKRAVIAGFVHRIYRACSSWELFHESIERAKVILRQNQYPSVFYEKIIHDTLTRIVEKTVKEREEMNDPFLPFLQYGGKCSESYARDILKTGVSVRVIFTLRKVRTVMPSLKEPIEKPMKSCVVYKISCPRCNACYVGQTRRHLQTQFHEHLNRKGPVKEHVANCDIDLSFDDVDILGSTPHGEFYLLTLEALWIREIKPSINTKDEFRSRELTIKI